jgi:ParB family chromosome partitioning protein
MSKTESKADLLKRSIGGNVRESIGVRAGPPPAVPVGQPADPGERIRGARALPLEALVADPKQPRKAFDEAETEAMAETMRRHGQLQPARVFLRSDRLYQLICGERRLRAARLAGLQRLDCIILDREPTPSEILEEQLLENFCRADLAPMDEAEGLKAWLDNRPGTQQKDCAAHFGISQARVSKALARLDYPADLRDRLKAGEVGKSAALELAKIEDDAARENLTREVIAGKIDPEALQEKVRRTCGKPRRDQAATGFRVVPGGQVTDTKTWNVLDARVTVRFARGADPEEFVTALEAALTEARGDVRRVA